MNRQKHLIVIGGATATGKTTAAIQVAQHFQTEILSADSRQFYREMSIGTAKPTADELARVPHHFINSHSVQTNYSVGDFEADALILLEKLFIKHDVVVLVGGSGLFIRACCEGLDEFPEVPPTIIAELESKLKTEGIAALQAELELVDPIYFEQVDLNNPHRLIRALSVCRASGVPFSSFRTKEKKQRFFKSIYLLMELERPVLYEKINSRVDEMIAQGLLEEASSLHPLKNLNALQTVGYQELFDFFEEKCTLEEAIDKIKQNSRRYAKRQSTWFRKDPHWQSFSPTNIGGMISYIEAEIEAGD
ncbi:MAG: tRNA (adenosine(37)-N6)-dimethylallyltransferase MiaA [Saprospiraceae bacterium]|nr:tRNA (adenosine(37)-N6)-dimethylallyltransferase MiaA [Saprospiraceae bacterium]MCF8249685.1 tRNA (adenosine(37)-N6)-dimethylallyltransferase MiaA [Saprospiraceae bacterium]MCF8279844.1 tRNA (adenosine(37)-N6)-dimethylallyltransferase MiaA [Bacteroidales bacterium]MCF8312328.1 tRNA (adenosine(37)-N6)-dimethylallyltransferase MiaA [Saprospiraceae bacterium]MCF8440675.1 tRNA (adenosine(37)-N6)-dimethylallyltransferase MiaA [Saprospiraceae bacterium]